jgi:uncharacterized RDD family membrane protein YckC
MAQKQPPIDSTMQVVTPENIAFEYRVAGPFRRLPAYLIDWAFIIGVQFVLQMGLSATIGMVSRGMVIWVFIVTNFILGWFYWGIFETCMNGQTPGKWLLGLRVLTFRGEPINGMQAIMRNLLRSADILIFPQIGLVLGLNGVIVMSLNRRYQRLGDLVAGTIVVIEDRQQWLTGVARLEDPRAIQLASFLPPNFVVSRSLARALSTYVERRRFFSPLRRREVARHLGEPLLRKFGLPADTSYDLLLCALYYRTFIANRGEDERRLAEATAAARAQNPFVGMTGAGSAGIQFVPPPPSPLPQEQMSGTRGL